MQIVFVFSTAFKEMHNFLWMSIRLHILLIAKLRIIIMILFHTQKRGVHKCWWNLKISIIGKISNIDILIGLLTIKERPLKTKAKVAAKGYPKIFILMTFQ